MLVDPRTWRINAIVVRTKSGAQADQSVQSGAEETIVVPVEHMQRATVGAVYLSLTEEQVSRLPRFDPADYPSPDNDWQPPTPYRREDIAFDMGREMAGTH
jgi:hypothetical protein